MDSWILSIFVFCIGAMVGSFLNVCIYRLPQGLSIAAPRSFCPACQTPIRAYDNIPIISFLLLGGKCRKCRDSDFVALPLGRSPDRRAGLGFLLENGADPFFFLPLLFCGGSRGHNLHRPGSPHHPRCHFPPRNRHRISAGAPGHHPRHPELPHRNCRWGRVPLSRGNRI